MQAGPTPFLPFSLLTILVFLVCLFAFAGYLTATLSGWNALARRFRAQSEPYGDARTAGPFFYSVYMRYWTHYGGVIRLTAADDALYLSVLFLIRAGHPPLRIPWNEIQITQLTRFWRSYVVLTLGKEEQIPLRIYQRMARKLAILDKIPMP
jgi:hypothetical protein